MSLLNLICLTGHKLTTAKAIGTDSADVAQKYQVVSRSPDRDTAPAPLQQKYLPVIDTDRCIGCERCVNVCDRNCLEMIWSFSTLTHPQTCCGEAHCAQACPEQIIHMAWVPLECTNTSPTRQRG